MNKGFLTAFLVATAAFVAKADLLYWQINKTDNITWLENRNGVEGGYVYASVLMKGEGDSGFELVQNYGPNSGLAGDTVQIGSLAAADIGSDYASSQFYVELYDAAFEKIATSGVYNASALGAYISAAAFNESWTIANTAFGTGMQGGMEFVPEPTSGILLLLGAAMLGLKRKRA